MEDIAVLCEAKAPAKRGAIQEDRCMIRIDKMYQGFYVGGATPPSTNVDYRSPEILSAEMLAEELLKRGAQPKDIEIAFEEADRHWMPLPPRQ